MSYRTANLQKLHFIYYSTNIRTEYFKHAAHSPVFSLQNAVYFIMLHFLVPVLFKFYIQSVIKFLKNPAQRVKPDREHFRTWRNVTKKQNLQRVLIRVVFWRQAIIKNNSVKPTSVPGGQYSRHQITIIQNDKKPNSFRLLSIFLFESQRRNKNI